MRYEISHRQLCNQRNDNIADSTSVEGQSAPRVRDLTLELQQRRPHQLPSKTSEVVLMSLGIK